MKKGIAPLTRWRWVVSFKPSSITAESATGAHWTGYRLSADVVLDTIEGAVSLAPAGKGVIFHSLQLQPLHYTDHAIATHLRLACLNSLIPPRNLPPPPFFSSTLNERLFDSSFSVYSTIYPHRPPIVSIELSPSISSRDKYHAIPESFLFQSIIVFVLPRGSPHRILWTPTIPPHTLGTALA